MHFQIFLPGVMNADAQWLDDAGLAELGPAEMLQGAVGPDGHPGLFCAWRKPDELLMGFHPEKQEWFAAVPRNGLPAKRYWVGVWKNSLPTPADLVRRHPFEGTEVSLGDGNAWTIPAAVRLPHDADLTEEGEFRWVVQKKFEEFWKESQKWYEALFNAREQDYVSVNRSCFDFALRALCLNYRMVPELAVRLRLFSNDNLVQCLWAAVEGQTIRDVERQLADSEKKTDAPADTPAT